MEGKGQVPKDGFVLAIGFIFFIFFLNMLSRLGLAPLLPIMEKELGFSHGRAGSLFLFMSLGYGCGLFASTFTAARWCHQRQIVASSVAVGLNLLLVAAASGVWTLRGALLLLGFAGGLYLPSGVATLTAITGPQHWGKVLALHQMAPNMAYICSPLLANLLLPSLSWQGVLAFYGTLALALGLAFFKWARLNRLCGERPSVAAFRGLLTNPALWIMILLFTLALGVNQGLFSVLPLYLTAERHLDAQDANRLLTLSRLVAFGMPLLAGWAADRLGLRPTLAVAVAGSSVATCLLALLPGPWLALALIMQASSSVCFFPLGFAVLSRITTQETRNLAVAVAVPASHWLGAGLVPWMIGIAGDAGRFPLGVLALGGATALGLGLLRWVRLSSSP